MITVQYYGMVRQLVLVKSEQYEAQSITELLNQIKKKHGTAALLEMKRSFILVNGSNIALLKGYRTKLRENDVVKIMTVTGGG